MNKHFATGLKNILLLFVIGVCFNVNSAFASDNVLQAIQVNGVKDSYNIILKSDDVADLRKTIQAPNKMVIDLKGIRASKTINTIYNNTSSVDSVVVEPTGEDSVKILVQAENVGNANVHFDTLKTPLGVLDKAEQKDKATGEIVLSGPVDSYRPVYDQSTNNETSSEFSLLGISSSPVVQELKKVAKGKSISWAITIALIAVFIANGMKNFKGKDSDIKIGLSQSLKDREINLYKELNMDLVEPSSLRNMNAAPQNAAGANYGLRAYQNGTKSPYVTSEIQRPRPTVAPSKGIAQPSKPMQAKSALQTSTLNTIQKPALKTAPAATRAKTTNIDSIKFLESMTKIYEKNGRSDLAQGLKANIKKAKTSLV